MELPCRRWRNKERNRLLQKLIQLLQFLKDGVHQTLFIV